MAPKNIIARHFLLLLYCNDADDDDDDYGMEKPPPLNIHKIYSFSFVVLYFLFPIRFRISRVGWRARRACICIISLDRARLCNIRVLHTLCVLPKQ